MDGQEGEDFFRPVPVAALPVDSGPDMPDVKGFR